MNNATGGNPHREAIRVLLIEDDPDNARLVAYILGREGYHVDLADSAEDALEITNRGTTHDLVVTDLVLPGMDGLEFARILATSEPTLPVILMTAHSSPESSERARQFDVAEYLHKPLMAPALLRAVERATHKTDREVLA